MNRLKLKENAKKVLSKNHWMFVVVAFLATLGSSSGSSVQGFSKGFFDGSTGGDSQIPHFWEDMEFTTVIIGAILFVIIMGVSIALSVFVLNQLKVGAYRYFLKARKDVPVEINELFQSYKDRTFINVAKTTFIKDLVIGLWSLLCFIPGVIKYYDYWATEYILAVRPDTNYTEAMQLSQKIMRGHRLELLELQISFLGWYILVACTCGLLGIFYVGPYTLLTYTEFYSFVRTEALRNRIATIFDLPDYENPINQNNFNNAFYMNNSGQGAPQNFYMNNSPYNQGFGSMPKANEPFVANQNAFDSFANSMPSNSNNGSSIPKMENSPEISKVTGEYTQAPTEPVEQPSYNSSGNIDINDTPTNATKEEASESTYESPKEND